jgi:iron-only hydrogenase group A
MNQKMINITIDGKPITVPAGTTIMQAAERELDIRIPRLCYHPNLSLAGSCRVCIVEVKGFDFFMASCSVEVWEGMDVKTSSPEIRRARRDIVELLLDNHPKDCQTCERDGRCELQNLAYTMGVRERLFEGKRKSAPVDDSGSAVVRTPEKCILCGRCVRVCSEVQGVNNLNQHGRGFETVVAPGMLAPMDGSVCIQCGQCINVCPTAAFVEKSHTRQIWKALEDPEVHVVVHTAPSVRAALGEEFDNPPGTVVTGKMVSALRLLGFDAVFDTNLSADLTIVEESNEFLQRLAGKGPLPMLTSCSPGWISFLEKFYPEFIPNASTCKSPMSMLSSLIKTYYAEKKGIDPDKIFVVAVMPCTAKKYEAARPELRMPNGKPWTDAVLTTRGLAWMIKCYGVNFNSLEDSDFDAPLGVSTGAGDIFGSTGGVMEATLRTAYEKVTGQPADKVEIEEVRAVEGLREASIQIGDKKINVAVANGLNNAKKILDKVIRGEKEFHVIEIMACPGGCIGGGGQPRAKGGLFADPDILRARARALYRIDESKQLRKSHENPALKVLYKEFLGEIGGEKAHELLHTHYHAREPRGIR